MVHGLIVGHGLDRFYDIGGAPGAVGEVPRAADLQWLPDLEAAGMAAGVVRLRLDVQGIRCAACVWLLQQLWRRRPGAMRIDIDPSLGRLQLVYRRDQLDCAGFLGEIARFGYRTAPARQRPPRDTGLLVRLGICTALAMNAMVLGYAGYLGLDAEGGPLGELFSWVLLGLGTASVAVGGPVFFRPALLGLGARLVHLDLPISLGIALAWAGSVAGQFTVGQGYFDTLALFVAFMLAGRFLQERTLARNRDQVLADDGAEHLRVRRNTDGRVASVPVTQVRAGDELLLAPGDLLPVRARVLADSVPFSLDWINGESEPREFGPDDDVPAGSFLAGRTAVRAVARADYLTSGLAELLQAPPVDREDHRGRVRFWERLNRWYAVAVLTAAALGAGLWLLLDPSLALPVAVAVLVVTCPCAVGIATPLAFHLALSLLRRRGVWVRSAALLDKLARVRKVIFDKTGTVTLGGLRARPAGGVLAGEARDVLGTMTASSNHPASKAILAWLGETFTFQPGLTVTEVPGGGLHTRARGATWRLGSPAFAGVPGRPARESVLMRDGAEVARLALEEDFLPGAAEEIGELRRRGIEVHLLSGDRPDHVAAAAARLGIAPELARGGCSPQEKAELVSELDDADTLMVGDGINDVPAFAAAFCAGTPAMDRPVLPARSDFFHASAQGGAVRALLDTAALLRRTVRANLRLALVYNVVVLGLSLAGEMTPLLCAVLMPISSAALVLHTGFRFAGSRRRAA